jgi:predicted transcriptional regulator YdeE
MNAHTIQKFNIIGVKVRTTNENKQAEQDIPVLWGKLFSEGVVQKIPNKIDDTIYCIYTDYEKDHTKAYTVILGCKVSSLNTIPEGMTGTTIETGNYAKYVAKGNIMQGVVQDVWESIWKESDLPRAYTADFDVYGDKAQNLENGEVDIFVSIKA